MKSLKKIIEKILTIKSQLGLHPKIRILLFTVLGIFSLYLFWYLISDSKDHSLKTFCEKWVFWLMLYQYITNYIPWFSEKSAIKIEEEALRKNQKERIQILNEFDKVTTISWLSGKRSVYESIIDVLDRAIKIKKHKPPRSIVQVLLCSPSFDYNDKNRHKNEKGEKCYKYWGEELKSKIKELTGKSEYIDLTITYLPDFPIFGYYPIKDFIAVLANYCNTSNKGDTKQFEKIYTEINNATSDFITYLKSCKTITPTLEIKHKFNIPFQIVLVHDTEVKDVVVAFAGREILESGKEIGPKGFRSSDPFVVETFANVYKNYVDLYTRRSFPPIHTLEIEKKLKERTGTILIKEYLKDILPQSLDLIVHKNVFCPTIGNSSKFTSLVLVKNAHELKDKEVLDVGSGTGVQAIVAAICGAKNVVATESDENARKNIQVNINRINCNKIQISNGDMFSNIPLSCKFDIIIGDVPFVNSITDQSSAIQRCLYDNDHNLHKILLTESKKYLKEKGKLYTSFSTLGGPEDLEFFEMLINDTGWKVLCKHTFYENSYGWIIYELSQTEIDWLDVLNVKIAQFL